MGTVLFAGATAGVGRRLARILAERGETVPAHGRDRAELDALAKEAAGTPIATLVADLSSLAEVRALAGRIREHHGRLDVLVNNAGIGFGAPGSGRQTGADGHEPRRTVNYLAPALLTRSLLPLLRAAAPSRIVNEGSLGQGRSTSPIRTWNAAMTAWWPTGAASWRWRPGAGRGAEGGPDRGQRRPTPCSGPAELPGHAGRGRVSRG